MKKNNNKGFTLAELLIVVAIIAVLTAVAIPVFTTQLEKSRDATSIANIRSAYAEAQVAFMTETSSGNATYDRDNNTVTVTPVIIQTKQANDWSDQAANLPFDAPDDPGAEGEGNTVSLVFTYDSTNPDAAPTVTFGE